VCLGANDDLDNDVLGRAGLNVYLCDAMTCK
jgi:hypothetical protein